VLLANTACTPISLAAGNTSTSGKSPNCPFAHILCFSLQLLLLLKLPNAVPKAKAKRFSSKAIWLRDDHATWRAASVLRLSTGIVGLRDMKNEFERKYN
jgi:hypothetical protein